MTSPNPDRTPASQAGPAQPDPRIVLPPLALLSTHIEVEEQHAIREKLQSLGISLVHNLYDARVLLARIGTSKRAQFELRRIGHNAKKMDKHTVDLDSVQSSGSKRVEVDDADKTMLITEQTEENTPLSTSAAGYDMVRIVSIDWVEACIATCHPQPFHHHTVFTGYIIGPWPLPSLPSTSTPFKPGSKRASSSRDQDGDKRIRRWDTPTELLPLPFALKIRERNRHRTPMPLLEQIEESTEDERDTDDDDDSLPIPEWIRAKMNYSCQRATPAYSPNREFIEQLQSIRSARHMNEEDEREGIEYAFAIAAIAAYPYVLSTQREIQRLPGCNDTICRLWSEWNRYGKIRIVEAYEHDESLQSIRLFYNIYDVGVKTAWKFYHSYQWTTLEHIIRSGRETLSRTQWIGLQYYNDFLQRIPRQECEDIASVVRRHATDLRGPHATVIITGSYRRGAETMGDVDLLVSHPDPKCTYDFIDALVASLTREGWIAETLLIRHGGTKRGQVPISVQDGRTLRLLQCDDSDKAYVVWQNTNQATNKDPRRRVDIVISPWRTLGCAMLAWTGGGTFVMDLKRYARDVKGWLFHGNGIRSLQTGDRIDLEVKHNEAAVDAEEAERRVFDGLGLTYRPPEDRCTG